MARPTPAWCGRSSRAHPLKEARRPLAERCRRDQIVEVEAAEPELAAELGEPLPLDLADTLAGQPEDRADLAKAQPTTRDDDRETPA